MITDTRPLVEINQQAISLLYKELGVIDAVRFLKQFTQGYGNYTQERETLFADKSLEDIVSELRKGERPLHKRKGSRAQANIFGPALFLKGKHT